MSGDVSTVRGHLTEHEVARQLVGPGSVVIEGSELHLEDLDGVQGVAGGQGLQILLLHQDVLHLHVSVLVLQVVCQVCQDIDGSCPVTLQYNVG